MKMHRQAARMAAVWLLTGAVSASASQVVWETLFDPVFAPGIDIPDPLFLSLMGYPSRSMRLSPASGGDFYSFAIDTAGHATLARHAASDDAVVWSRSVGLQHSIRPDAELLAGGSSGGGAWLTHGGATRFSADGHLLWSRAIPAGLAWPTYVRAFDNGDLALAQVRYDVPASVTKGVIMRADGQTGAIRAQRELEQAEADCRAVPIGTDASDHLYVSMLCGIGSANGFQRLVRLAPDLSVLWNIGLPANALDAPGYEQGVVTGDGVYFANSSAASPGLSKFDAADGHPLWSVPGNWSSLRIAGDCVLGVRDADEGPAMRCLDPATGQMRWSRTLDARYALIETTADVAILAGVDASGASGFADRIDLASGASIWHAVLAASTAGRVFHPRDLLVSGDVVRVAGADCLPLIACVNGIARIQAASGQTLGVSYPPVPQTATVDAAVDAQSLLVASIENVQDMQQIRVKRIDPAGSMLLERVLPVPAGSAPFDSAKVLRLAGGDFAAMLHSAASRQMQVVQYDASGQPRWQQSFWGALAAANTLELAEDGAGNVVVSNVEDTGWPGLYRRWVRKLDAGSGQVWQLPLEMSARYASPVGFWPVGDDLLVTGEPQGATQRQGPRRHAGADGSVLWSNPSLARSDSWLLAQHEDEGYLATLDREVVAFSLTDGSLRWRYVSSDPNVDFRSARVGSDGDLYVGGAGIADEDGRGALVRLDRHSGAERWIVRLDESSTRALALPVEVVAADAGVVDVVQASASRRFVSRFDAADGRFIEGTMLSTQPEVDEAVADDDARIARRLPDGSLLAYGLVHRPGESRRPWVGRLVAPAQGLRGDLSMALSLAPSVTSGASTLDLSAELRHAGEQSVQATAFVRFSHATSVPGFTEVSIETAPSCVVTGIGSCQAIPTPTGIRLQLDLAPGAVASLTASLRAPLLPATRFVAEAYAPYGFFEADLRNNAAVAWWVTDRYFADDFE
ncbi:MAG TPA: PQQ-binding-like beta-propeller repeat protein [Dokdonella sp.]|uniref:outer membrane protein assembly factor BamB family protein n=1 Tax=Dokdonella sp. TaxID=2291710 RepID=UPI002CB6DE52|nr:PQQ-binding-like beta-propeller repeat protein [Dokdonella sp.]HUD40761.1 PQQ-binding-like beta-propeller repeat protein [Dokdonella sp.]